MGTCVVKLTKVTTHTALVDVDLKGNSNDELDDALNSHMTREQEDKYLADEKVEWELDDEKIEEYEVDEYNFDEEE